MLPYMLVYGKTCHLLVELEHRAYLAIKKFNFDMQQGSSERRLQLAELKEIRNDAYENAKIYKQWMKFFHDKQIMRKSFTPGQKVILWGIIYLIDIRLLIKAKIQLAGELPLKFIAYMLGCGKENYWVLENVYL